MVKVSRLIVLGIAIMAVSVPAMAKDSEPTVSLYVRGRAPVATDVTLTGPDKPVTGDTLHVSAKFSDPDGDPESGSKINWYHGDGSVIAGATGKEYEIQAADSGKKIQAGYIPATDPAITDPYEGSEVKSALTDVITGKPDAAKSTFMMSRTSVRVTGTERAVLSLTLQDSAGNPVKGIEDRLSLEHHATEGDDTVALVKNNEVNGVYSFIVTGTKTGKVQFTPQMDLKALGTTPATLTLALIPGMPDQDKSTLSVDKKSYTAGDDVTVTATLHDANGNNFTGPESKSIMSGAELYSKSGTTLIYRPEATWMDNGNGTWTAKYTADVAGSYHAMLKLPDWTKFVESHTYSILAGLPVTENSSLTTDNNSYYAGNNISMIVTLRDKYNNPAKAAGVVWTVSANNSIGNPVKWIDKADNVYLCQDCVKANYSGKGLHAYLDIALPSWKNSLTSSNSFDIIPASEIAFNNAKETGIIKASFTLRASRDESYYTWSTNRPLNISLQASRHEIGSMLVTYIQDQTAYSEYEVVATPRDPRDKPVIFKWNLKKYFFTDGRRVHATSRDCHGLYLLANTVKGDLEDLRRDWGPDVAGHVNVTGPADEDFQYWYYYTSGAKEAIYDFRTGREDSTWNSDEKRFFCEVQKDQE